jgi:glycosyltransferase involved in cell wall biosynthesis
MAEVTRDFGLDVIHAHYAVPHATAAILARSMLPAGRQPRVVTTLHGTDTTLLGRDPGYGPAITHALRGSDAVTTVSEFLRGETQRLLAVDRPIDVIHNFFAPRPPKRSREEVRRELGLRDEVLLFHSSNLSPVKRVDHLISAIALIRPRESFKLVVLAGEDFSPFIAQARQLGVEDRIIVCSKVRDVEDYACAADLGIFGIPEVVEDGVTGLLAPFGDIKVLAALAQSLIHDPERRRAMGLAAQARAKENFSAEVIVPRYEALYYRVIG